jgi:uncharacterized protein (DUF433 family)
VDNVQPVVRGGWHDVAVNPTNLLDRAIYSYSDVDRLVGLRPGTAHRWIDGYRRGGTDYPPVLRPERTGSDVVTWGEMVEARLLAEFRDQRVSVRRLRPAVERLRAEFGPYPLAHARPLLEADGQELVRRVQDEVGLEDELMLVVVRNGQLMLDLPAQRFADAVEYTDGIATLIRPVIRTPAVQLDPNLAFGQPSIRGIRTDVLAEDYRAGESRESLAELYDLDLDQIDQALRYELIAASSQQTG